MKHNIVFQKITKENLNLASSIQNEIFPEEDGTANFVECIEKDPYRKELDFYIAYDGDIPIGVTGVYSYHEYPEDAWLGWFGILEEYRKQGYGSEVFDLTVDLAKSKGYKNLRLYSDDSFQAAHRLYTSKGMIKEIYDNELDVDPYAPENLITYIFSLSLTAEKVSNWNNKILGLKEQGMKEHLKEEQELKITIEMASSINGLIATEEGSEDFLSERGYQIMLELLADYDCLVWGNTTFKNIESWGENYLNDLKDTNLIIFSKTETKSKYANVSYCNSLEDFKKLCQAKNIQKIFISGGAHINSLFMKNNLVDEIIINYNPYVLGKGINLFEGNDFASKLELEKVLKEQNDIVQIWYKVRR